MKAQLIDGEITVEKMEAGVKLIHEQVAALPKDHQVARRADAALSFWHGMAMGAAERAAAAERQVERLEAELAKAKAIPAIIATALMDAAELERRPYGLDA